MTEFKYWLKVIEKLVIFAVRYFSNIFRLQNKHILHAIFSGIYIGTAYWATNKIFNEKTKNAKKS